MDAGCYQLTILHPRLHYTFCAIFREDAGGPIYFKYVLIHINHNVQVVSVGWILHKIQVFIQKSQSEIISKYFWDTTAWTMAIRKIRKPKCSHVCYRRILFPKSQIIDNSFIKKVFIQRKQHRVVNIQRLIIYVGELSNLQKIRHVVDLIKRHTTSFGYGRQLMNNSVIFVSLLEKAWDNIIGKHFVFGIIEFIFQSHCRRATLILHVTRGKVASDASFDLIFLLGGIVIDFLSPFIQIWRRVCVEKG
mmetsp:Transcript_26409/g.54405  ORF Transcript_26409/g.54405 Transcript_26409/m.54405 type:complete len:248 (+) Transcript_26409:253-996(+)